MIPKPDSTTLIHDAEAGVNWAWMRGLAASRCRIWMRSWAPELSITRRGPPVGQALAGGGPGAALSGRGGRQQPRVSPSGIRRSRAVRRSPPMVSTWSTRSPSGSSAAVRGSSERVVGTNPGIAVHDGAVRTAFPLRGAGRNRGTRGRSPGPAKSARAGAQVRCWLRRRACPAGGTTGRPPRLAQRSAQRR